MAPKNIYAFGIICVALMASATALTCDEFAANTGSTFYSTDAQTIESSHPYCNSQSVSQSYSFDDSSVTGVNVVFDSESNIENFWDTLTLTDAEGNSTSYSGSTFADLTLQGSSFSLTFSSDFSSAYWGYSFTATPVTGTDADCSNFSSDTGATFTGMDAQTIESSHPYCSNLSVSQHYSFTDSSAGRVNIEFDDSTQIETYWDSLVISYTDSDGDSVSNTFTGSDFDSYVIDATEFDVTFSSDSSVTYYGYSFTATPLSACSAFSDDTGATFDDMSDQTIESAHPYCNNQTVTQNYSFTSYGVTSVNLVFDSQSQIENYWDSLVISYTNSAGTAVSTSFSGSSFDTLLVDAASFSLTFTSDFSTTYWGYSITATPYSSYAAAKEANKAAYKAAQAPVQFTKAGQEVTSEEKAFIMKKLLGN